MKLSCLKRYLTLAAISIGALLFWIVIINWAIGSPSKYADKKLENALSKNKCHHK